MSLVTFGSTAGWGDCSPNERGAQSVKIRSGQRASALSLGYHTSVAALARGASSI